MANTLKVDARGPVPVIELYGVIGEGDLNPAPFSTAIKALGGARRAELRISSPGGDCFAGNAMYGIAANTGIDFTVRVDGLAASMGSLMAMVGKHIIVSASAQLMVHFPSANGNGGAGDLARQAKLLESIGDNMARTYAARTRQSEATIRKWMADETWFDAEAAVKAGFADEVGSDLKMAAAVDLGPFGYKHAPAPKSAREMATAYWAGRNGKPAPADAGDISDLVPKPRSHEEVWSRWNANYPRGRADGVK